MQKNSLTNKISPCGNLPFSVVHWWVSNLTLNSESDRPFILSKISQNGTISIDGWKVLANSATLETDASFDKPTLLSWFDCGKQPSKDQLKIIIEGLKVGNWTPENEVEIPLNLATIDKVVNGSTYVGNVYTKQKVDEKINDLKSDVKIGINGNATQSNAPTVYSAENFPNGLFERYVVSEPLTSPNSWGNISVSQNELDSNFVFLNVKNGVVSKEVSKKVETTAYLVNSENAMIRNAFKGMELSGLWKGRGLWVETVAYTSFNNKLTLAIKDKDNKLIFAPVNVDVSAGFTRIPLSGAFINGAIYVDFSKGYTFQEVVNFPINEGFIVDLNSTFVSEKKYQAFQKLEYEIALSGKILVVDETQVSDAGFSITDFIPVSDGMQIIYKGSNNANSQYYDVAHIYNEFGEVVQRINQGGIVGSYEFEITADDAKMMRVVVQNTSLSSFELLVKNEAEKTDLPNYENIETTLINGKGIAFDGTVVDNGSYKLTDFTSVEPNSIIGYNGFLSMVFSIVLFDANKRFIKSVLRPTGSEPNVKAGQFTTTRETAFIRASVTNNRMFRLFYISKNATNVFPSVMQGYKTGENFSLENGIEFLKISSDSATWEKSIEMNSDNRLKNVFLMQNRKNYYLKNQAEFISLRDVPKKSVLYGVSVSGNIHTVSVSIDGGLNYSDLFSITDSKIGELIAPNIRNVSGVLFIQGRMKTANLNYAEEVIYRAEKTGASWTISEVLLLPYSGAGIYRTFEFNWGFSAYKNKVVINDYGTAGTAGRIWLSNDYGKTFVQILNIYQAPHTGYINGGHIHGSSYDPIFNRIWATTGDGYTNTYILWSDDLGTTWNRTQTAFKDENGTVSQHTQFTGIVVSEEFILFNHDSPRSGVYRYNRGKKTDSPIIEWVADITDHSKNEIAKNTQYSGSALIYKNGVFYCLCGWHDSTVASEGVLGKIIVSKDGYNWDVFYSDKINPTTGRGFITSNSLLIVNEKNVFFSTESDKWVVLDLPYF